MVSLLFERLAREVRVFALVKCGETAAHSGLALRDGDPLFASRRQHCKHCKHLEELLCGEDARVRGKHPPHLRAPVATCICALIDGYQRQQRTELLYFERRNMPSREWLGALVARRRPRSTLRRSHHQRIHD